jgi:release factor glutamine methyltransferase
MTLSEALHQAAEDLASHDIADARLEAEILLAHLLKIERTGLYVNSTRKLPDNQALAYSELVRRRLNHEPTAYITGHKEFFGLDFQVNPTTLIPRPDTELLVEKAIELAKTFPLPCLIADVGTGCGAIAIALATHLPGARIYATDISAAALEVARNNCQRYNLEDRITLLQGNLLEPLPTPVHLIVANLPYIRESELAEIMPEISKFEPRLALSGGEDGLQIIKKLISQVPVKLIAGGTVLLEIGYDQGTEVSSIVNQYLPGARVSIMPDLSGVERVAIILTTES